MQQKFLKQQGIWIDISGRFFFCLILMLIWGGTDASIGAIRDFARSSQNLAFVWVWTSGMELA